MSRFSSKFLPFREAREYVRNIGLAGYRDWKQWCKSSRPPFIPSNPDKFYASEFQNFPDWLGYDPSKGFRSSHFDELATHSLSNDNIRGDQNRQDEERIAGLGEARVNAISTDQQKAVMDTIQWGDRNFDDGSKNQLNIKSGIGLMGLADLLIHMKSHAPKFEFMPLPREALVSFLIRPIDSDANENESDSLRKDNFDSTKLWTPLYARTVTEKDGIVPFTRMRRNTLTPFILGYELYQKEFFVFPIGEIKLPHSVYIRKSDSKYNKFRIPSNSLESFLEESWNVQEHRRAIGWFPSLFRGPDDKVWAICVASLWANLYNPLGLAIGSVFSRIGYQTNLTVNGRVVMHRCATLYHLRDYPVYTGSLQRIIDKKGCPIYHDDMIDYFVFMFRWIEGEVQGAFVFPKTVLADHGHLKNESLQIPGCVKLGLYPPFAQVRNARSTAKQQWQSQYYLDLSNEAAVEDSRLRLLKIFQNNG